MPKTTIVEIIRDKRSVSEDVPLRFRVGEAVMEGGYVTKTILYCPGGYNGGTKGRWAAYAVKFEETKEVRMIPESEVVDVCVIAENPSSDEVNSEAAVDLPESTN